LNSNIDIQKGYWIWFSDNKIFRVIHKQYSGTPLKLQITAWGVGHLFSRRITIPPSGYAYDSHTGSRDAIVKHFITTNLISPTDTDRAVSILAVAENQSGTSTTRRPDTIISTINC
jgi:hypothetical protein